MRIIQIKLESGERALAVTDQGVTCRVQGVATAYELASAAIAAGEDLAAAIARHGLGEPVDLNRCAAEGRLLAPVDHPDTAHLLVTGTGLTHLGSASGRDAMHAKVQDVENLTDSMKMFKLGLAGGKPAAGEQGVQPEWFYKGDGAIIADPGAPLTSPDFALDGGEEPELVGVYLIGPDGTPYRLGFALGNEFSDHVTEQQNYLYLAHSKLRPCSFGPELLLGALPADIRGASRIRRGNAVLWEKEFWTGEANMSHSIANLEAHHFKYAAFRRPGDLHVHYFGTATLSFSDGIRTQPGDVFEIEAPEFGLKLANPLGSAASEFPGVTSL
ncbi:MAG: FAH family protein [Rhodospirillales bacterium 20-64-7]|nr:MAG: FAH family protein [Rhodospirillales bacterium 20-64-7]